MTELDCTVKNCIHNSDNCCCRHQIAVEGLDAGEKSETCCGSFVENEGGSFKNVFKSPESKLDVECAALKCAYNDNRFCIAQHIGIAGDGAGRAEQTQCSSFRRRE